MAQEFEVSQAPVREAFRELETLGIVVSRRYHGTHVREISSKENREIYELRGYLEEIAAQLIPPERLKEALPSIEALQASMRTAAQNGDMDGYCARQHSVSSNDRKYRIKSDAAESLGLP